MDSDEDCFYGSDEDCFYAGGGSDDSMSMESGVNEDRGDDIDDYDGAISQNHKPYKILTEDDIRRNFDSDISTVADALAISRGAACDLLCQNNWILRSACDQWLAADRNPQSTAANSAQPKLGPQVCNICCDEITSENSVSAACGHPFCSDCCKIYIATAINGGPGCLKLLCPVPGCGAALGVELVESLASEEGKDKYYKYLRRSYVELSDRRKWCPAPGCGLAVEFDGGGRGDYGITCGCGHKFCWNCMEENHRPVDCQTRLSWMEKNNSEEENTKEILAYTKPCPKCCRPIEKNQGCNVMVCGEPCGFSFCWLCLESLKSQSCNNCSNCSLERGRDEKKEKAMEYKYIHCYERWHSNEQSRKVAMTELRRCREEYISKLGQVQGEGERRLQFVMDAWEQIVECRRVLKWSHAYGYYLEGERLEKKRSLFEYLQGEAETGLERLHNCAKKEMMGYLGCYEKDFKDFRTKLIGLTSVTKDYFENMVKVLENNNLAEVGNNLAEVGTHYTPRSTYSAEQY